MPYYISIITTSDRQSDSKSITNRVRLRQLMVKRRKIDTLRLALVFCHFGVVDRPNLCVFTLLWLFADFVAFVSMVQVPVNYSNCHFVLLLFKFVTHMLKIAVIKYHLHILCSCPENMTPYLLI